MKHYQLSYLSVIAPILMVASAADLPPAVDAAFRDYTALPSRLIPILQKAQDKESADEVAPELRNALTHVYEARNNLHSIRQLTPAQSRIVNERYAQKMREEWAAMYAEINRLRRARCYQSAELLDVYRLMCMMIEK